MSTASARPRRTRPAAAPWRRRTLESAAAWAGAAVLLLTAGPAAAQDAERGARLFNATRSETGRPVGNCVACHASREALTEIIRNRGSQPAAAGSVARLLQRAIDGAQPGALGAKAQYREVLTPVDVRDLAAYLARSARS